MRRKCICSVSPRQVSRPEWLADPRFATLAARLEHEEELDALIEQWTCVCADYDVMVAMQQAGVVAGVVQNVEDLMLHDRQLAAREFFEEIEHVKKGKVVATGMGLGLSGTPGRTRGAGAAIGQDNDYVFRQLLGLSPEEVQAWLEAGVIEAE